MPKHTTATRDERESEYLTKQELADRLHFRSTRMVDELVRRRKIPVIIAGHRTRLFHWPSVQQALSRLTVREVS